MPVIELSDNVTLRWVSPPGGVPVRLDQGCPRLLDQEQAWETLEVCLAQSSLGGARYGESTGRQRHDGQPDENEVWLPVRALGPGRWVTDSDWLFLRHVNERLRHPEGSLEDWLDVFWPRLPPALTLDTAMPHPAYGSGRPLLAMLIDIGVAEFDLIALLQEAGRSTAGLAHARVPVLASGGVCREAGLLGYALGRCCHALASELDALGCGLTPWEKASGAPLRAVAGWGSDDVSEGFPSTARRSLVRRWRRRLLDLGVGRLDPDVFFLASRESPLAWAQAALSGSSPLLSDPEEVQACLAEWRSDLLAAGDPWVASPAYSSPAQ